VMGPISRVIDPGVEAFVVRGADGGVISSGYRVLVNVGEAFHAEICACLHATQRTADLGFQRVILATDASMVV
jgi:ribonuclease HI